MEQSPPEPLSELRTRRNFARVGAVLLLAPTVYFVAKTGVEFVHADHASTAAVSAQDHHAAVGDLAPTFALAAAEIAMIAAASGLGEAVSRRENGE